MSFILNFRSQCRTFLQQMFVTLIEKCPIKKPVVRGVSAFDPPVMIVKKKCGRIDDILKASVENGILDGSGADHIKREYLDICATQETYLKTFIRHSHRLDDFLLRIQELRPVSVDFLKYLKIIFTFFSSNGEVKRSFSVNKECLVEIL